MLNHHEHKHAYKKQKETNYESDIELSNELKRLSRSVKKLQSSIPTNPTTPADYVEKARIEAEITDIANRQTTIGTTLLERDKAAEKRKAELLTTKATMGTEKANELLQRLPEFADKVSIAFKVLGDEYAELLQLSTELRQINQLLLNANLPQCVPAAVKIEPNNMHKLLKEAFRESFGSNTADVFLPQKTDSFDIVDEVKEIAAICTAEG